VRLIAATNKKLRECVAAGAFREDLFYRLQIVPIFIPPLRERADDIPLLIEIFLDNLAAKHKRRRKKMSPEALRVCQGYTWPGNVRELRNMMERLVITCPRAAIQVDDLPDLVRDQLQSATTFMVQPGMPLAEIEKLAIRQTLLHVTKNREAAAKILGLSRRALQYKLKRYGLLPAPVNAGGETTVS
jgi:transcriptional regulator with PAS, ATPase and Fis domain